MTRHVNTTLRSESDWVCNIRIENKNINGKKKYSLTLAVRVTPRNSVFPKRLEPLTRIQYGGASVRTFFFLRPPIWHRNGGYICYFSSLALLSLRAVTHLKTWRRDDTIYSPRWLTKSSITLFSTWQFWKLNRVFV